MPIGWVWLLRERQCLQELRRMANSGLGPCSPSVYTHANVHTHTYTHTHRTPIPTAPEVTSRVRVRGRSGSALAPPHPLLIPGKLLGQIPP